MIEKTIIMRENDMKTKPALMNIKNYLINGNTESCLAFIFTQFFIREYAYIFLHQEGT